VRQLLDANAVAKLLGVKTSWVYAQARAGRIPHIKLGRYTRFEVASLEEWAAKQKRG
jgi:excisionase family DNA binding protein